MLKHRYLSTVVSVQRNKEISAIKVTVVYKKAVRGEKKGHRQTDHISRKLPVFSLPPFL